MHSDNQLPTTQELRSLTQQKEEKRLHLLTLPPDQAQQQVNQVLHSHLWKPDLSAFDLDSEPFSSSLPAQPPPYLMSNSLTPCELQALFLQLQSTHVDILVVGGQAINLWASVFYQDTPAWNQLKPFASEDLDLYGSRLEAIDYHNALGGTITLARDFDPSPNAGVVITQYAGKPFRVDILSSVYGINDAEIQSTAMAFMGQGELAGLQIRVLNPILCLERKLRCLRGLPQTNRQDLKHTKLAVLIMHELIKQQIISTDPRPTLNLIERVLSAALREDGLSAWYHHSVCVEAAVPLDVIQQQSQEQWQGFYSVRYPQYLQQLDSRRDRYQQLIQSN